MTRGARAESKSTALPLAPSRVSQPLKTMHAAPIRPLVAHPARPQVFRRAAHPGAKRRRMRGMSDGTIGSSRRKVAGNAGADGPSGLSSRLLAVLLGSSHGAGLNAL